MSAPEAHREVVIVDDDPSVLRALTRQVSVSGYVACPFKDANDALLYLRSGGGQCLLVDLNMPGMSGLDLQLRVAEGDRPLPVVFLSGQGDVRSTVQAMRGGAIDFLEKPVEVTELVRAIDAAFVKYAELSAAMDAQTALAGRLSRLTVRQREVFDAVVTGLSNKEIARDLRISERTVKAHRHGLMQRLEARTLPDLVNLANQLGLVAPEAPSGQPESDA
ncbi:response regulator transcription factor [Phaeobacter marinintestinus]|uniref:response regulator transcription factor n=1 Tax=Falsiphaeobacter marinintestinus TaxID=1492905 RepID=UPI0016446C26|nr:response regulator [Phaeobacter marinintestinus]